MDCAYRNKFVLGVLGAGLLSGAFLKHAPAAVYDNFDGPQVSWRSGDADVPYRLESHQRVFGDSHSGQASELIQLTGDSGKYVYFLHDFGTARIVAELSPRVWIKANRPGVQLLARVVLPHTIDPRTGQPLVTLIRGSKYSTVGIWQQLQISDTPQLLSRQLRVLIAELGPQVNGQEAYVDQLLLNVYGGPGQTVVNIDDLEINGVVPRNATSGSMIAAVATNIAPTATQAGAISLSNGTANFGEIRTVAATESALPSRPTLENAGAPMRQVSLNGSILLIDGRPMFPRIVQSQGEPLGFLKDLGFNAVRVSGPPSEAMLTEAQQAGVWLIAAPPLNGSNSNGTAASGTITNQYSPVLAWHLGDNLAARELPATSALAKQIRLVDRQLRRPLLCNAEESLTPYSRHFDLIAAARQPLGTSLELKDYGQWLMQRPRLTRPGTPLWTSLQTEAARAVSDQDAALTSRQAPEPAIDLDSLRLLVYQAFVSGVRGMEFISNSRLDAGDVATRGRAAELALLNLELELMEPWGAAGSYVGTLTSNDAGITGVVLHTESVRLIVAIRAPKDSQYVPAPQWGGTSLPPAAGTVPLKIGAKPSAQADAPNSTKSSGRVLERSGNTNPAQTFAGRSPNGKASEAATSSAVGTTLIVPGVPESHDVWELTPAGLQPLRHQRVSGGTSIAIDNFSLTAVVLITPDPLVANAMSRRTTELAPRAARLQREVAAALLAQVENVSARLGVSTQLPPAASSVAEARVDLQRADQLLATGNIRDAYLAARLATVPLGRWKREVWERAVKQLQSPVSDPLAVSFNTLPDHLSFMASTAALPPGENLLPGGQFEDLANMQQTGWQHFEHPQEHLQTSVELSPELRFEGDMSLHLQVRPDQPQAAPALVESPPLWITSAPVRLQAGDVVCIRGQIRVPNPIAGSVDGLMIFDSLGGEALAERIGPTSGWKEFVMYRAAAHDDSLTLKIALTGIGEAWIDNVSIRPIRRGNIH